MVRRKDDKPIKAMKIQIKFKIEDLLNKDESSSVKDIDIVVKFTD